MAGGDQSKNTAHENAIGWMILLVIFFVVGLLVWPMIDEPVKSAARWFRYGEMWIIGLFVDADDYRILWGEQKIPLKAIMKIGASTTPQDLNAETFSLLSAGAMQPLKWLFVGGLGFMALWAYSAGPGTQFRRRLGLDGLIGVQAKVFKVIQPFVKFNPSKLPPRPPGSPVPSELPLFAEALGPEEWVAYNQVPVPDGKLDTQAAYMAFARQLGPRWQGYKSLPPYKQVLLAAFCMKAARKRKEADDMLGRIATCWSEEKGLQLGHDRSLLGDARKVLGNNKLAGGTLQKANMHAFQTTALLRALQTAREQGGVMAPAQFVWLRGHDRTLWYPLNNLGRQGFHMEALGAMAHFKAEKLTSRPIPRPKLDTAIGSLNEYMGSRRARPIPQLDYSNAKKGGIKKPKSGGIKKPRAV